MNHIGYFSTLNEIESMGIEGKTFLEVGCGPCPIGKRLVERGAGKIYGLDISQEMIASC
jgi:ubiquinone/menaquinone biosynthesis C-methylase UbiE